MMSTTQPEDHGTSPDHSVPVFSCNNERTCAHTHMHAVELFPSIHDPLSTWSAHVDPNAVLNFLLLLTVLHLPASQIPCGCLWRR